jgi:hypothetical protein
MPLGSAAIFSGGIPIDVFWSSGELPAGVWVPDQGVPPYRGRGRSILTQGWHRPCSQPRFPLESYERIMDRSGARLGENHRVFLDLISNPVAFIEI